MNTPLTIKIGKKGHESVDDYFVCFRSVSLRLSTILGGDAGGAQLSLQELEEFAWKNGCLITDLNEESGFKCVDVCTHEHKLGV